MGLTLVSAPASEPISATEAKSHCRIDIDTDDTLIAQYIKAARQYFEGQTRRALVEQTWDYTLPRFPNGPIEIPIAPVMSITSVNYVNSAGGTSSWSAGTSPDVASYDVTTDGPRTRIFPKWNQTYPVTREHGNAVTVRFVAGYSTVPADILQVLYLLVDHFYEIREPTIVGTSITPVPMSVEALMSAYSMRGF